MSLRVCIPTAGLGSRLGNLTTYLNKSLIDVAGKPMLSRIIEMFPEDTEFVIALGYRAELIREYLSLAHPERQFYFAEVSPYEGIGSGLGFSLLQCAPYLQQPFIFVSCDTLVREPIPAPQYNWAGWCERENLQAYRTLSIRNNSVLNILEKNMSEPDCQPYIGMAGIADYKIFWEAMQDPQAIEMGEAYGLRALLAAGKTIREHHFTWYDTGSLEGLSEARNAYTEKGAPTILAKQDEAIWFVGEKVIKFSASEAFIQQRVARATELESFIPSISGATPHMYAYQKANGEVLSRCITPVLFAQLLDYAQEFWLQKSLSEEEKELFHRRCMAFYKDKTLERVQKFYDTFHKEDSFTTINGQSIPPLRILLEKIEWKELAEGLSGRFHGDFHFENILWDEKSKKFTFLDWRQNFGGDLHTGDIYYDFAKLLHGLIINHSIISRDLYKVSWSADKISYDFLRKDSLIQCEKIFMAWITAQGFSWEKVQILTSLIFLNIAALHHYPYSLLLYALGKNMLFSQLNK